MSIDAPLSDAELLAIYAKRTRPALGPNSPLRPEPPIRRNVGGARVGREHAMQCAVFAWIDANVDRHPALALCYAVPNGGHRRLSVAAKLKKEGLRPGVPDVVLPVPRGGYGALYLELKIPGGVTSPAQADWQYQLAKVGNCVRLATTAEAAIAALLEYDGLRTA